jgi:WD40 repeat protein
VSTGAQQKRYVGHTDFVNCITTCHVNTHIDSASQYNECLLISGSVDATIIVWRVESGERLHTLKGHSRGILDLAIDPLSPLVNEPRSLPEAIFVLSASSTPEIRSWRVSLASASEITTTLTVAAESDEHDVEDAEDTVVHATDSAPFSLHDTSVNRILFSPSSPSSGLAEYDLYTASSDNTSKILARPKPQNSTNGISSTRSDVPSPTTAPPPQWTTTSTFTHPDWVRAIAHDPASGLLVTACRDEEVRVWDTNEGECIKVLTGHFDSVEGVTFVDLASKDGVEEKWIVSVSLDGTLRRWKLKGEVAEDDVARQDKAEEEPEVGDSAAKAKVVTTEDEDRELAELMAELEDDD